MVFIGVGSFIQRGGVGKRVILKKLAQWFRVLATKPLTKEFLESCALRFFLIIYFDLWTTIVPTKAENNFRDVASMHRRERTVTKLFSLG